MESPISKRTSRMGGHRTGGARYHGRMSKTYFIRTYGCQMNEHDSERIAGLLELNGYARAEDAETADLVLFNTCAIRENADKKLYGTLGQMKRMKDARPELRIAVGGCQVQKDKALVLEKAP